MGFGLIDTDYNKKQGSFMRIQQLLYGLLVCSTMAHASQSRDEKFAEQLWHFGIVTTGNLLDVKLKLLQERSALIRTKELLKNTQLSESEWSILVKLLAQQTKGA